MSSIGPQLPPHLQPSNDNDSDSEEEGPNIAGPQFPPELLKPAQQQPEEDDDDDDYTPALPPDLAASRGTDTGSTSSNLNKKVLGPSFPSQRTYDEDSDDDVGPMPLPAGYAKPAEVDGVKQFLEQEEKRRKNIEEASKPQALKRDEWMLKPPTSSDLLGTLDPSKLTKARQFSRSTAPAKTSEGVSTLWTETPAERQQRLADEVMGKKRKAVNADDQLTQEEAMEMAKRRRRDEEIRQSVDNHTTKVRGAALVDSHSSSLKKSGGDEEKDKGIWDHERDMAVGGRLMDDSSRNKMIRDAKALGDRFSTGKSGGFL
ncbi:hypothetical protein V5O48_007718 [Marasmius crinis-equi]|uniref:DUF3752 domain-containing protein n=1 Tax=Marasmius crinis-equi TaxID=585013 RepID=A0ABR3FFW5_9AGAR